MTKEQLIAKIDAEIATNGRRDITGAKLNEILKDIVNCEPLPVFEVGESPISSDLFDQIAAALPNAVIKVEGYPLFFYAATERTRIVFTTAVVTHLAIDAEIFILQISTSEPAGSPHNYSLYTADIHVDQMSPIE